MFDQLCFPELVPVIKVNETLFKLIITRSCGGKARIIFVICTSLWVEDEKIFLRSSPLAEFPPEHMAIACLDSLWQVFLKTLSSWACSETVFSASKSPVFQACCALQMWSDPRTLYMAEIKLKHWITTSLFFFFLMVYRHTTGRLHRRLCASG